MVLRLIFRRLRYWFTWIHCRDCGAEVSVADWTRHRQWHEDAGASATETPRTAPPVDEQS